MRRYIHRQVFSQAWQPAAKLTYNLATAHRVMHCAFIVIAGTLDLTASATKSRPGGLARMAKLVELQSTGYNVATNERRINENRMSIPGELLCYAPQSADIHDSNRINFLNPTNKILAGTVKCDDVEATSTAAQKFRIVLQVPFFAPNGRNPRDLHVDTSQLDTLNLNIECASMAELFTAAAIPASSVIKDANVEIWVKELAETDSLAYRAGTGRPMGYVRQSIEVLNIDADNNDLRRSLNFDGNLVQIAMVCNDSDGEPDDSMLVSVRLERDNQVYYDMTADMIRMLNYDAMPMHSKDITDYRFFNDSGIYIISTTADDLYNRNYYGDMQHLKSDNSCQYVLNVKAPSSGKGTIKLMTTVLIPSDALAVVNTPFADLTGAQREAGRKLLDAKNERAGEIVAAARVAS